MITRRDFIKVTATGSAFAAFGNVSAARTAIHTVTAPDSGYVMESERKIPVIAEVDIVIIGGTSAAVSAAGAASRAGSRVFLAAPLPYPGDDICGSFRIVCGKDETPDNALSRRLFLQTKNPTPLHIKTELENELLDNDVNFLYSSYVTNILTDASGSPAGVVITNRSGRQAIRSKAIIDATHIGSVARLAGAALTPFQSGKYNFGFVTTGSQPQAIPDVITEEVPYVLKYKNKTLPVIRYTFPMEVKEDSYATLQEIEQAIRDKTWTPDQCDSSDVMEFVPFVSIVPEREYTQPVSLMREIPPEALKPDGIKNLWVLSPSAGVSRETAAKIMRPVYGISLGETVGEKVAADIKNIPAPKAVGVFHPVIKGDNKGDIRELLLPFRPDGLTGHVTSSSSALPVLGTYDVVVMGGGTAGAPAAISAARQGAKTLLLEYLHGLGGIMTLGLIGRYYTGMGQFGPCMSRLDSLLIALGKSRDSRYLPVVLEKARLLNRENTFSHFRAIAMATEEMKSPDAAPVLYDMLTAPGMRYHHIESYRDARSKTVPDTNDVSVRNAALKELHLARALYACGDKDNLGASILKNYAKGLHGHYARYANAVLTNKI
jgi:hypothetical protein